MLKLLRYDMQASQKVMSTAAARCNSKKIRVKRKNYRWPVISNFKKSPSVPDCNTPPQIQAGSQYWFADRVLNLGCVQVPTNGSQFWFHKHKFAHPHPGQRWLWLDYGKDRWWLARLLCVIGRNSSSHTKGDSGSHEYSFGFTKMFVFSFIFHLIYMLES